MPTFGSLKTYTALLYRSPPSVFGAAYVFRRYGRGGALEGRLFGFFFALSSVIALFAFGWSIALATTGVLIA